MTSNQTPSRTLIRIGGDDRVSFLQGILTSDIAKLNDDKIQFSALLSPQGKILHDMFLIAEDNSVLLDSATAFKDTLLKRLAMYKLRAKVTIEELTPEQAAPLCAISLPDPRHPGLPPYSPLAIHQSPLFPELGRDFAPDSVVALDAGYDLLNAISFTKGCYVGQEVTARMHYKNIARRGFYLLEHEAAAPRLALLKFEGVDAADGRVVIDGISYRATLPAWLAPKYAQYKAAADKQ